MHSQLMIPPNEYGDAAGRVRPTPTGENCLCLSPYKPVRQLPVCFLTEARPRISPRVSGWQFLCRLESRVMNYADALPLRVGMQLGPYEITGKLGSGGMGV